MLKEKIKNINWPFWNIWTSYATYYFGRVNLGIIIPALLITYKDMSLMNVGLISSGFLGAYALGQFIHGQISERCNPIRYIAFGLIGSAFVNLFLGFTAGFFFLLLIGEIIDGFFQSMGWTSTVRANTLIQKDKKSREKSSIILGTSYQVGHSIAWLISAFAIGMFGWQAGFWVAALFLAIRGITLLKMPIIFEKEKKNSIKTQIKKTLKWPIILSGVSLGLLNMVRYGVITWIPLYLFTVNNYAIHQMGKIGLSVCLIPIMGVLGTLVYHRIKINKDILTVIYLVGLAISFFLYSFTSGLIAMIILFIGSFCLYGPHVFLVSTFPVRFVKEKIVAASTGIINGIGYIGSMSIGILVPLIIAMSDGSWDLVFYFWSFLALLVAILVLIVHYKTKTTVYAYVCGDILHIGHLRHLKLAKKQGNNLIVGVLTDEAIMEKKTKPIIPFEERFETIEALEFVDLAVPQNTYSPLENIKEYKPDVLMESSDHHEQPANEYVDSYGGEIVQSPYYQLQSSSKIKKKIRQCK